MSLLFFPLEALFNIIWLVVGIIVWLVIAWVVIRGMKLIWYRHKSSRVLTTRVRN